MAIGWAAAMSAALYGEGGFFVAGAGPAAHFRTSAHVVPVLGTALVRLLDRLDAALGRPDRLDVVDVGAGRGELLTTLARLAPSGLADRLRLTAVELAPRPPELAPAIDWRADLPERVVGLLLGTEWLDNVPLEVVESGPTGWRRVLVEPATGVESAGGPVDGAEADWLARWWPAPEPAPGWSGAAAPAEAPERAEIGLPRDDAWAAAVAALDRGLALAVDYGHLRQARPPYGTLTGFRDGRQVPPVPDGRCDLTAHVAIDSVAAAGSAVAGLPYALVRQRAALRALGVDGARPPLALASTDPAGYVRALAAASTAAELTDPAGLGGHWWLFQPVGIAPAAVLPPWPAEAPAEAPPQAR
ncbi:SAM-dependent methyltransferase [Micromonospora sp. HM5-17]|uniref:SAM-dependent methyltransferase n=1 Tax=Micromonospora sp. HM5-17 TaxID=2487710 RepID=UPI00272B405E|nr:SAM-dependent methyltransferase [Micromonospora sp. HM5-17]